MSGNPAAICSGQTKGVDDMKRFLIESLLATTLVLGFGMYLAKSVSQVKTEVNRCTKDAELQVEQIHETMDRALLLAEQFLPETTEVSTPVMTSKGTRLVSILYDENGNYMREVEETIPVYLSNLTREQVESFFENIYCDYLENRENTTVKKAEMISFSPEMIVVKKHLNSTEAGYYLCVENDCVVVYYADRRTLYDTTGIPVKNLTEAEQQKLTKGFIVESDEELFSLLESYTS